MKYQDYINSMDIRTLLVRRDFPVFFIEYSLSYTTEHECIHSFSVLDNYDEPTVEIKNNGEIIYGASCTCDKFKRKQECKHIAAVLLNYHYVIVRSKIKDLYKEISNFSPSTYFNN